MKEKIRYYYVDIVKFIAVVCLFLAHVNTPSVLMEIRGFDVPTMVVLSGILAKSSYERSNNSYEFIIRRVKRLVIPTWIFLVGFYICMFFVGQMPSYSDIFKSFLFQRDSGLAGYVWVIWIYILCALVVPFYSKIISKRNKKHILYIIITIIVIYELVCKYTLLFESRILYYTLFSIIPYGIITWLAMLYTNLNKNNKIQLIVGLLSAHLICVVIAMLGEEGYIQLTTFKYPARFYYWSYGVPVGFLLIELFKKLDFQLKESNLIVFVSKHSLWIYLWHIFALAVVKYVFKFDSWILQFCFVFGISLIITLIQIKIVSKIKKIKDVEFLKYFLC